MAGDGFRLMVLYCEKGEDGREDAVDWRMEIMERMERMEKIWNFQFSKFKNLKNPR